MLPTDRILSDRPRGAASRRFDAGLCLGRRLLMVGGLSFSISSAMRQRALGDRAVSFAPLPRHLRHRVVGSVRLARRSVEDLTKPSFIAQADSCGDFFEMAEAQGLDRLHLDW